MYGENAGDDELMHEAFLRTGEVEGVSDFLGNKVNIELLHEELPADQGFLSFPVGDGALDLHGRESRFLHFVRCLLYTSDAADE